MLTRSPYQHIWQILSDDKAMVFLAGPRQSGKTTLAKQIAAGFTNSIYCNWDISEDRRTLLENPAFFTTMKRRDSSLPLVVFDEIHKYRDWKNYLKGIYDRYAAEYCFLVTGSGRLDLYQRGGDSLAGRYLLFNLFPFTTAEMNAERPDFMTFQQNPLDLNITNHEQRMANWQQLEECSGFPEPFLKARPASWRRWSGTYNRQLLREDIRDMSDIRQIDTMESLFTLLPSRIGSPLSIAGLSRDLGVSYATVQSWLALFEQFFLTFSIPTWTERIARAILKERKVYLFDYPRVTDQAARFENQVALELLRGVTTWNNLGHGEFSLHFIKNKEQQEVDFLIVRELNPWLLIEAKLADEQPSKSLLAIQKQLQIPAIQLVKSSISFRRFDTNNQQQVLVAPACHWLSRLPFA